MTDNEWDEEGPETTHSMTSRVERLRQALTSPELHDSAKVVLTEIGGGVVREVLGADGLDVQKRHGKDKGEISKYRAAKALLRLGRNPVGTGIKAGTAAWRGGKEAGIQYGKQRVRGAVEDHVNPDRTTAQVEAATDSWDTPASDTAPDLWASPAPTEAAAPDIWDDGPSSPNVAPPSAAEDAFAWDDGPAPNTMPPIPPSAQIFPSEPQSQPPLRK